MSFEPRQRCKTCGHDLDICCCQATLPNIPSSNKVTVGFAKKANETTVIGLPCEKARALLQMFKEQLNCTAFTKPLRNGKEAIVLRGDFEQRIREILRMDSF